MEKSWTITWLNKYGSILDISDYADNRIIGTFRTALSDSGFYGQEIPVTGIHQGEPGSTRATASPSLPAARPKRATPQSRSRVCAATANWKPCGSWSPTV